jgi:predicted DNA-binding transcriptional regulator YafY
MDRHETRIVAHDLEKRDRREFRLDRIAHASVMRADV